MCDEYQNFATVGGDNPTGDERFLSLSRQPKCIPIVATQSISSLKDALPNEGVKTLLQALRNKVFLITTDPETARYASELCGKADRTRLSYTRIRVFDQCQRRMAFGSHLIQQRFRLRVEAVSETHGAALRGEGLLRSQERTVRGRRIRRNQSIATDVLLSQARLPAHRHVLVRPGEDRLRSGEDTVLSFELIIPFLKPIEHLLLSTVISEIMVNPDGSVWIEEQGRIVLQPGIHFEDGALLTGLEVIANRFGKKLDADSPIMNLRLPDGEPHGGPHSAGRQSESDDDRPQVHLAELHHL